MGGQCPRCLAPIARERFIGNSYICKCGWTFTGVSRRNSGSMAEFVFLGLVMLSTGFYFFGIKNKKMSDQQANAQIERSIQVADYASRSTKK